MFIRLLNQQLDRAARASLFILLAIAVSGCKAGIPSSKNPNQGSSKIVTSTKSNLASSGGVAVTGSGNYKVKFTIGYNQVGPEVSSGGSNYKLSPTSTGVARAR